ncbi:MAG: hypothetical protein H6636_08940 [Anaerolineales bacterium]|nr:hypothetical protein [Anaerolineales bacterium]
MFDPSAFQKETPPPERTPSEVAVQTASPEIELLFSFPLAEAEKSLIPYQEMPRVSPKIRIIFFDPDQEKTPRLPRWLHELVGWGVFLTLLTSFLGLQIYLNRLLRSPASQVVLLITVVVEISLLWRWDQYWY